MSFEEEMQEEMSKEQAGNAPVTQQQSAVESADPSEQRRIKRMKRSRSRVIQNVEFPGSSEFTKDKVRLP